MKILLTGGIGSGKTTVAKIFQEFGVPVYFTDKQNRKMLERKDIQEKYNDIFKTECFNDDNSFKKELLPIFYNNAKLKTKIENIMIPILSEDLEQWTKKQTYPYIIVENAIAIERGIHHKFDKIIVVHCNDCVRIQRIRKRDGKTIKAINDIMKMQASNPERLAVANYVILNNFVVNGKDMDLKNQVTKIHKNILNLCNEKN